MSNQLIEGTIIGALSTGASIFAATRLVGNQPTSAQPSVSISWVNLAGGVLSGVVIGSLVSKLRNDVQQHQEEQTQPQKQTKTLYERIGGADAMDAAIELFYKKMLADDRVKDFFNDVDMVRQKRQQHNFLTTALGGPQVYKGKAMAPAHAKLVAQKGLNDMHFDATAENLQNTLKELGVDSQTVQEVMDVVGSLRDQILCRGEYTKALKRFQ